MTTTFRPTVLLLLIAAAASEDLNAQELRGGRGGGGGGGGGIRRDRPARGNFPGSSLLPGGSNWPGQVFPGQSGYPNSSTYPNQWTYPNQYPTQPNVPVQPATPVTTAPGSIFGPPTQSVPATPAVPQPPPPTLIAKEMNALCWSLYRNYRQHPEYREAYQEAYELLDLSRSIEKSMTSGETAELGELVDTFAGELPHLENHIKEFAGQESPQGTGADDTRKKLASVKQTLQGLVRRFPVAEGKVAKRGHDHDHDHDHEKPAARGAATAVKVPPAELSQNLVNQMNAFCVALHRHHAKKEGFKEAYDEAFELLDVSKEILKAAKAGGSGSDFAEHLAEFDSEFHHVENHVSAFATATLDADQDEALRSLDEVEASLHTLMQAAGVRPKHVVAAGQGKRPAQKAEADVPGPASPAAFPAQATELTRRATLFCNSMHHNYRNNADFKEAYAEALELYHLAQKVEVILRDEGLGPQVHEVLDQFDSELHHLENHVDGFVADDGGNTDGPRRLGRKLEELEQLLHEMMDNAGMKRGDRDDVK